ncbi:hypothetical protein SteCoe_20978 [Stentor coeruleus]|uniref:Uncharacterized protein n=1 Tax=Stentor coeruleus TaxID=5963 RepID=A0A1R2BQQ8_9CILI|nr:hypothetical protein SteCoe_20978 [Stentor coeruleus]
MSYDDGRGGRDMYYNAKKSRSLIDNETRSIENRIKMIKFEEARALKRIQETRERISEVYKARTRYLEDKHIQNISKERQQKELMKLREAIQSERQFHQEKQEYTKHEILNVKQNLGKRVRGWKEYIKRNHQQQIIDQKRHNRKMKEAVEMSSKQGAMRLKLLGEFKEQKARVNYIRKVEQENQKRTEIEMHLSNMGKEEQLLMQRVANIHELQKQAVEELEKVYI